MKFGKRFTEAIETASCISKQEYISYKSLKTALKLDCSLQDALGGHFEQARSVHNACAVPSGGHPAASDSSHVFFCADICVAVAAVEGALVLQRADLHAIY